MSTNQKTVKLRRLPMTITGVAGNTMAAATGESVKLVDTSRRRKTMREYTMDWATAQISIIALHADTSGKSLGFSNIQ